MLTPFVAVVDDDVSVRRAVKRLLTSANVEAVTYASAQEFLEREPGGPVGCLVLDIHLGGMTGFSLHELLKATGEAPPTVFITAHDDPATREQARLAGAAAYLRKPFDAPEFLKAVFDALGREVPV